MLLGLHSERLVSCTLAPKLLSGSDCEGPSVSAVDCELGRCCSQGWRLPRGRSQLPPEIDCDGGASPQLIWQYSLRPSGVQLLSTGSQWAPDKAAGRWSPTPTVFWFPCEVICCTAPKCLFNFCGLTAIYFIWLLYTEKKLTENLDEERKGWGKNCTKATNKH